MTLVFALLLAFIGTASYAQTCGGLLSCTGVAYEFASSGVGPVLEGINTNTGAAATFGVYGSEKSTISGSAGVQGDDTGSCTAASLSLPATGVLGTSGGHNGVTGVTNDGPGGVVGYQLNSAVCPATVAASGTLGAKSGANVYALLGTGNLAVTGTKSFIEPHPTDATKEIRYVALEGPESGTYFRGTGRTVNGFATIEVPESFRLVTATDGLTAVVTPTGALAQVAVISKSLDKIVIQSSTDVAFDYVINGVRKAFPNWEAVSSNQDFIPQGPNDSSFFALPAESQRRLIATGIYHADGTVNLETAHQQGWDLLWQQNNPNKAVAQVLPQGGEVSISGFLRFAAMNK